MYSFINFSAFYSKGYNLAFILSKQIWFKYFEQKTKYTFQTGQSTATHPRSVFVATELSFPLSFVNLPHVAQILNLSELKVSQFQKLLKPHQEVDKKV